MNQYLGKKAIPMLSLSLTHTHKLNKNIYPACYDIKHWYVTNINVPFLDSELTDVSRVENGISKTEPTFCNAA